MKRLSLLLVTLIVLATLILVAATVSAANLSTKPDNQETVVLGQTTLSPGSPAGFRVLVRDHRNGNPVANANVKVSLSPQKEGLGTWDVNLGTWNTDASGVAAVSFTVPETADPAQTLIVESDSTLGRDRVARPVTVQRAYKILLTTDKPLYQPGQVIHIRALALSSQDLKPASQQSVEFVAEDAKGN